MCRGGLHSPALFWRGIPPSISIPILTLVRGRYSLWCGGGALTGGFATLPSTPSIPGTSSYTYTITTLVATTLLVKGNRVYVRVYASNGVVAYDSNAQWQAGTSGLVPYSSITTPDNPTPPTLPTTTPPPPHCHGLPAPLQAPLPQLLPVHTLPPTPHHHPPCCHGGHPHHGL